MLDHTIVHAKKCLKTQADIGEDPDFSLVSYNIEYRICDTYPALVCEPGATTLETL